MKKILYIWKDAYPWDVRVDKVCRSLLNSGFNINILSRWKDNLSEFETITGFNIIRSGFNKSSWKSLPTSFNPYWRIDIDKYTREIKPDLILVRDIMLAESAGIAGKKYKIPVVMDMAEHYPAAMRGWDKYWDNYLLRIIVHYLKVPDSVEKKSVSLMNGIITICDELRNRIIQKYNYNAEKIIIAHNTPELDWFENVRNGPSTPPTVFAYHGFFSNDRNLDNLVKGFILAAQLNSEIKLVMAGEGESLDLCKSIAEKSSVYDRIEFKGYYNHKEIKKLYSEMDIGILPYKANEFINHTISNKLFDYLAVGKPVLVSQAIPMVRLVTETNSGIICNCSYPEDISEAIMKISNYNLNDFSVNGIKSIKEKYNWAIDSNRIVDFINGFL